MDSLSFRRSSLTTQDQNSKLITATGISVMACKPGGVSTAITTGAVMTFGAGHGFAAGDKALIRPGATQEYTDTDVVLSVTATTVTWTNSYSVGIGDAVFNLGADTSSTSVPAYDGGYAIYSDPAGSSALSGAKAATNSDGEYQYWHKGGPIWELMLSGSTVVEFDVSAMFGGLAGHITLSEPRPSSSGFNANGTTDLNNMRTPFRLFGADLTTPLVTMTPFAPTDRYQIVSRFGTRGNASGDSGTLVYASEKITLTAGTFGDDEHQAVYGINQYYGSGTATRTQMGILGVCQSFPGTGNVIPTATAISGVSSHNITTGTNYDGSTYPEGGTTTVAVGMTGTAQTGTSTGTASTCGAMYGVLGQVQHRSTAVTTAFASGIYGKIVTADASVAVAVGGTFVQPAPGPTTVYAVLLYADTVTPTDAVLGFTQRDNPAVVRTLKYSTPNARFEFTGPIYTSSNVTASGILTAQATGQVLVLGDNTDATTWMRFNTATNDVDFGWDNTNSRFFLTRTLALGSDSAVTAATIRAGADTPEGAVTAAIGSLYVRTNGGANTTLYVKESGTGNTGWVAK